MQKLKVYMLLEAFIIIHLTISPKRFASGISQSSYAEKVEGIGNRIKIRVERSKHNQLERINYRDNCTCGMRPPEKTKIVGGQLAKDNSWPWIVPLIYTGESPPKQFCGASLINTQYLLTASHCAADMEAQGLDKYQAYLGINSISDTTSIKLNFSESKLHFNFNSKTLENDVALLKLNQPVVFSQRVQPICLEQSMSPYLGKYSSVIGWGRIKEGENSVDMLREAKVKVMNNVYCAKNYSSANVKIAGTMMCAAGSPSKDSCQGDSGGPLVIWNPKSKLFTQIGIVSFGNGCGSPKFPGVYTRVASFIKWIQENTVDATFCQKSF